MSIDISTETLLTFQEAAKRLPGNPHLSSLHRWRLHGVKGIRLESVKVGGKRFTSVEALHRFTEQTTAAADCRPVPPRSLRQRDRSIEQAMREVNWLDDP